MLADVLEDARRPEPLRRKNLSFMAMGPAFRSFVLLVLSLASVLTANASTALSALEHSHCRSKLGCGSVLVLAPAHVLSGDML